MPRLNWSLVRKFQNNIYEQWWKQVLFLNTKIDTILPGFATISFNCKNNVLALRVCHTHKAPSSPPCSLPQLTDRTRVVRKRAVGPLLRASCLLGRWRTPLSTREDLTKEKMGRVLMSQQPGNCGFSNFVTFFSVSINKPGISKGWSHFKPAEPHYINAWTFR